MKTIIEARAQKEMAKYKITVKLKAGTCFNNRNDDITITADIHEKARNGRWVHTSGGCCHDEIIKYFPHFAPVVRVHLCDTNGVPMHAMANGLYFLTRSKYNDFKSDPDAFGRSWYVLTPEEINEAAKEVADTIDLKRFIKKHNILNRWKAAADEALKIIEELSGEALQRNPEPAEQFTITPEEAETIRQRENSTYYTTGKAKKNIKKGEIKDKINKLKQEHQERIEEATIELNIKLAILKAGYLCNNFVYYSHNKTLCFNVWNFGERFTAQEINKLQKKIDFKKLGVETITTKE